MSNIVSPNFKSNNESEGERVKFQNENQKQFLLEMEKEKLEALNELMNKITELREINHELNKLVHEQKNDISQIELQLDISDNSISKSVNNLEEAHEYKKKYDLKKMLLMGTGISILAFPVTLLAGASNVAAVSTCVGLGLLASLLK